MRLESVAKSDVGLKRKNNEDAFLTDDQLGLYAVADGMGGHAAGDLASQEAVAVMHDHVLGQLEVLDRFRQTPDLDQAEQVRAVLEQAVRLAAYQIFGLTQVDPDRKGMGTTLSLLLLLPGVAFIAHVGDSRIYILRGGKAVVATADHTYVAAMVAAGRMTPEEAKQSQYRNVLLRAVGAHDYVEVDTRMLRYQAGDVFMLCSDGLHGYLKPGELEQLVVASDLAGTADRLIQLALDRGGKDNITAVVVRAD